MKGIGIAIAAAGLLACASAPRGPTDAEVRATLDQSLAEVVRAVQTGSVDAFMMSLASEPTMILRGVIGPDGSAMNMDLSSRAQIRDFMIQVGAPPQFGMTAAGFSRDAGSATQTGEWTVGGAQTGSFSVTWRQNEQGMWQITAWRFDAY